MTTEAAIVVFASMNQAAEDELARFAVPSYYLWSRDKFAMLFDAARISHLGPLDEADQESVERHESWHLVSVETLPENSLYVLDPEGFLKAE